MNFISRWLLNTFEPSTEVHSAPRHSLSGDIVEGPVTATRVVRRHVLLTTGRWMLIAVDPETGHYATLRLMPHSPIDSFENEDWVP